MCIINYLRVQASRYARKHVHLVFLEFLNHNLVHPYLLNNSNSFCLQKIIASWFHCLNKI